MLYQSEFRKFKNINIFTSEEKILIEKFIKFDEECFHQIDLNNREIYWSNTWRLKVDHLQNANDLLKLICNLYDFLDNDENIFIKKSLGELHQFLNFFFDWDAISYCYNNFYKEYFLSFYKYLGYNFDYKPEKFLQFIKKINEIIKKNFLENAEDFKKINYEIKKVNYKIKKI